MDKARYSGVPAALPVLLIDWTLGSVAWPIILAKRSNDEHFWLEIMWLVIVACGTQARDVGREIQPKKGTNGRNIGRAQQYVVTGTRKRQLCE